VTQFETDRLTRDRQVLYIEDPPINVERPRKHVERLGGWVCSLRIG